MKHLRLTLFLATTISLLSGGLFYVALLRSYPDWAELNLVNTALSIVVATLSGVAAWLFLQGVSSFKQQLRHAYLLLCIGLILFGLAQAQYPIASYVNAAFWYLDGFISLPYLAAAIFIFWGVRLLARILEIRTMWAVWWVVVVSAVVIASLVMLLPHARTDYNALQTAASNALSAIDVVFITFAAVIVLRVRRIIAQMYGRAMTSLAVALGVNALAGVHYIIVNLLFARHDNWYFYDSMSMLPFLLGAILLVRAGYAMVLVNEQATVQTSGVASDHLPANESQPVLPIVDIIVYIAGLASKPQELDVTLDTLRHITARLGQGEQPSLQDEQQLREVYQVVEAYLVTREPLRLFTIPELRGMVTRQFNLEPSVSARLWQS